MLWETAFSLLSNVGKDTFDFITPEFFSFPPKSFLAILLKLIFAIWGCYLLALFWGFGYEYFNPVIIHPTFFKPIRWKMLLPFYEFCLDRRRFWSIVWTATRVCNCSQICLHGQLHSFGKKFLIFKVWLFMNELVQWPFSRRHSSYLLLRELIFRLTLNYTTKLQQIFCPCAWALKTHYLAATGSTVCSLSTLECSC